MDKVISIYWFTILFIVAAAVVYMVFLFYGKPYDVRQIEANLLLEKIGDCLSKQGRLTTNVFDGTNFLINENNFLGICNLNFNVEDIHSWEDDQYYVGVEIFSWQTKQKLHNVGVGSIKLQDCSDKLDNSPFCVRRSFYVLDNLNNQYKVEVFSSVRKTEKNVR